MFYEVLIIVLLVSMGFESVLVSVSLGMVLTQNVDVLLETLYARVCAFLTRCV